MNFRYPWEWAMSSFNGMSHSTTQKAAEEVKPKPPEPFKHWAQDPSMPLTLQSLADRVAQLEAHCAHLDAQLKGPPGKA